jgi:tetratricopeptide (TPR) repeat protein
VQSYTRRQLKEDRFQEAAKETVHWTVVHRKTIITVLVVAGIITAVTASLLAYNSKLEERASEALGRAMRIYQAPLRQPNAPADPKQRTFLSVEERAKEANKQFQQVADQFSRTGSGKNARYLAAVTALEAGDAGNAERRLKDIADSGDRERAALAKLALASLYRSSNRDAEAIKLYKDLIDHPTSSVPKVTAQFQLADAYQTKQPDEARRIYDELAKDKDPNIAQLARQKQTAAAR